MMAHTDTVLACLARHAGEVHLVAQALSFLCNQTAGPPEGVPPLTEHLDAIVRAVHAHRDDSAVVVPGLASLRNLSHQQCNDAALMGHSPALVADFVHHCESAAAAVQSSLAVIVLGLLFYLSRVADNRAALLQHVDVVVCALQRHTGDPEVARCGLQFLRNEVELPEAVVPLLTHVEAVTSVLTVHYKRKRVAAAAVAVLSALAQSPKYVRRLQSAGAGPAVGATRDYHRTRTADLAEQAKQLLARL